MALTLQCISRAACRQPAVASKTLAVVTPRSSFSPLTGGAAHFSPFSTAAVCFGDLETATPKALSTMTRSIATPKTTFCPQGSGTAHFSPFSTAAVSFGDLDSATPTALASMNGSAPQHRGATFELFGRAAAHFSPFSTAAVSFGDLESATPKAFETMSAHLAPQDLMCETGWGELAVGRSYPVLLGTEASTNFGASVVPAKSAERGARRGGVWFDASSAALCDREIFMARRQRICDRSSSRVVP